MTIQATAVPIANEGARHRFSVDDYHKMAVAGILSDDDRVELIEGDIVDMAPVGDPHVNAVDVLNEAFVVAVAGKARVSVQNPLRLGPHSEPQPDLLLLRRESFGRAGRPEDVLVLIEVSDTTLAYDRDTKTPMYARAGIPQVILVDLQGGAVLHYRDAREDGYRHIDRYARGDRLVIDVLPSLTIEIDVTDVLA